MFANIFSKDVVNYALSTSSNSFLIEFSHERSYIGRTLQSAEIQFGNVTVFTFDRKFNFNLKIGEIHVFAVCQPSNLRLQFSNVCFEANSIYTI